MSLPSTTTDALSTSPDVISSLANNVNVVGSAWIVSSALFTTYSTTKFLKYEGPELTKSSSPTSALSRPTLLTLYRFGGSLLLGILAHPNLQVRQRIQNTINDIPAFALPAVFLFLANFANSVSLNRIGISLTYTSKCAIPLITVLLTLLMDGKKALPSRPTLMSLIPIALGIAAASWNSPTFEVVGFAFAMLSCVSQSALNISSKRAMSRTGVAGPQAQRAMAAVGFAITCVYSGMQIMLTKPASDETAKRRAEPPAWLTAMAVTSYHFEYVLSFCFVKLVAPVTYGACDAMRRLAIILSGHLMFGGPPFSSLNIAGIGLALLGALAYSVTSSSGSSKK